MKAVLITAFAIAALAVTACATTQTNEPANEPASKSAAASDRCLNMQDASLVSITGANATVVTPARQYFLVSLNQNCGVTDVSRASLRGNGSQVVCESGGANSAALSTYTVETVDGEGFARSCRVMSIREMSARK